MAGRGVLGAFASSAGVSSPASSGSSRGWAPLDPPSHDAPRPRCPRGGGRPRCPERAAAVADPRTARRLGCPRLGPKLAKLAGKAAAEPEYGGVVAIRKVGVPLAARLPQQRPPRPDRHGAGVEPARREAFVRQPSSEPPRSLRLRARAAQRRRLRQRRLCQQGIRGAGGGRQIRGHERRAAGFRGSTGLRQLAPASHAEIRFHHFRRLRIAAARRCWGRRRLPPLADVACFATSAAAHDDDRHGHCNDDAAAGGGAGIVAQSCGAVGKG
mmetsp:Transcript_152104/g.488408  ORF Transcript_152104/g.488408 Transcript_152104/m.488408 type:complete len:270 (+) Transcript_152104:305-1114(+)